MTNDRQMTHVPTPSAVQVPLPPARAGDTLYLSDLILALTAVYRAHGDGPVATRDVREGWERSLIAVSRTGEGYYLLDGSYFGFRPRKPEPVREVFRFQNGEE
jgi:hypothetical protein